jgi:predicted RNA-binding protein YlxR (DUF448 family)
MGARAAIDGGEGRGAGPLRLCAATRTQKPVDDLVRFVPDPEGRIVPDLARRLPGRGVWVDATRQAVKAAVRQRAFARSLHRPVVVPEDLPDQVERLMARRLAEAVSLANKAGLLVTGFGKVDELIGGGRAILLIHAADAAEDGVTKLSRRFMALLGPERSATAIVTDLTGPQLDLAIGRSNVVHAAASEGGASRRLLKEALRLRRYRSGSLDEQRSGTQDVHERD